LAWKAAIRLIFRKHCWVFSIVAFTFQCLRNSTLPFFTSRIWVRGFLNSFYVSSPSARKTLLWPFWPYSRQDP
jgi:hypothetical protein